MRQLETLDTENKANRADSRETLLRQWEMLKLLPTRDWLTTADIVQKLADAGFNTTQRTVQRDMDKLSGVFPLECNEKSAPFGWRWQKGSDLSVPGLSVSEALTLKMVGDYLTPLLPQSMLEGLRPKLDAASQKLAAVEEKNTAARWTDKIRVVHPLVNMLPPDINSDVMAVLQDALLQEKQLEVVYQKFGTDTPKNYTLHPLAMVQRGAITYLVCTVFDYQDVLLFAVHRMIDATILDDKVEPLDGFDIDDYINKGHLDFGGGNSIVLKLWVSKTLGRSLRESPLSSDMQMAESDSEGYKITATVQDTLQLKWWLLSHSSAVKVLEPQALRDEVVGCLREALEGYDE